MRHIRNCPSFSWKNHVQDLTTLFHKKRGDVTLHPQRFAELFCFTKPTKDLSGKAFLRCLPWRKIPEESASEQFWTIGPSQKGGLCVNEPVFIDRAACFVEVSQMTPTFWGVVGCKKSGSLKTDPHSANLHVFLSFFGLPRDPFPSFFDAKDLGESFQ